MFQSRIVEIPQDKFRGKNVKMLITRVVPLFQNSNARVSQGSSVPRFHEKTVEMFHDKSAEVFPVNLVKTLPAKCQGRSVKMYLLSLVVLLLSSSAATSPSKCAAVYLTSSARMCPSRSAARCQDSSASRCQDKCVQQLSQHMANNTSLIQPGYIEGESNMTSFYPGYAIYIFKH